MFGIDDAVLGAGIGALGSVFQNSANQAASKAQMDFQERMSNTSYQRATADMKAAGLNPMLAYTQGGASSASGASYQANNVGSAMMAGASSAVNSGKTASMLQPQIQNLAADTALKGSQDAEAKAAAIKSISEAKLANANSALTAAQLPSADEYFQERASREGIERQKARNQLPEGNNRFEWYGSPIGKFLQTLGLAGSDVGKATSAVGNIPIIQRIFR